MARTQRITTPTQARRALARALRETGRTQAALAASLGISQPMISNWLSGRYAPTATHRAALELLFGIPARAWMTAAERRIERRLQTLAA